MLVTPWNRVNGQGIGIFQVRIGRHALSFRRSHAVPARPDDSHEEVAMVKEFKSFLLQTNALALAVGVIIGGAVGKVVSSLVSDILMPVIGLAIPGGAWRELKFVLSTKPDGTPLNSMTYGAFIGAVVDFVIVAFCVFLITKGLLKPAPAPAAPPTKSCPACLETIPRAASKCRACGSAV
jgi:large conductance mechanosensitive channel